MANTKITSANLDTNIAIAGTLGVTGNITGTLATAAQTNITSVGTLTSFRSTGIDDNADATAITIDSSENVGIGTTSPQRQLHVLKVANNTHIAIERDGTDNPSALILGANQNRTEIISSAAEESTSGVPLTFLTGDTERMRIDASGNVGIGTSSPQQKLVVSDGGGYGFEFAPNFSSVNQILSYDRSADAYRDFKISANQIILGYGQAAANEAMRIDSSGNVGIGTSSPASAFGFSKTLEIQGGANAEVNISQTDNSKDWSLGITNGVNYQQTTSGQAYAWWSGGTERMRLNSSGQLGIACTDQSNLLTVDANSASSGTDSISVRNRGVSSANHTAGLRFQFNSAVPSAIRSRLTNTSNGEGTLSFFTSSDGTAGNLSEKMTIISGGDVCIGKTTNDIDTQGWHVIGAGTYSGSVYSGITGAVSTSTYHLRDTTNNTWKFYVENNGTIRAISTSISALSDERLKENVVDLETGLTEVMSLKPRRFDWKEGEGSCAKNVAGFVAQEVETVLPDLIENFMHDDLDDAKSVKMGDMIPTLVKAIQELKAEIEELKK